MVAYDWQAPQVRVYTHILCIIYIQTRHIDIVMYIYTYIYTYMYAIAHVDHAPNHHETNCCCKTAVMLGFASEILPWRGSK